MVVRPKHVADNLNKIVFKRKPLTLTFSLVPPTILQAIALQISSNLFILCVDKKYVMT
jgi:hypothetical protein